MYLRYVLLYVFGYLLGAVGYDIIERIVADVIDLILITLEFIVEIDGGRRRRTISLDFSIEIDGGRRMQTMTLGFIVEIDGICRRRPMTPGFNVDADGVRRS